MTIRVWREAGGYRVEVPPPHSGQGPQSVADPITRDEMRRFLDSIGVHVQDLWDALEAADREFDEP